jgi:hypothetical protein
MISIAIVSAIFTPQHDSNPLGSHSACAESEVAIEWPLLVADLIADEVAKVPVDRISFPPRHVRNCNCYS